MLALLSVSRPMRAALTMTGCLAVHSAVRDKSGADLGGEKHLAVTRLTVQQKKRKQTLFILFENFILSFPFAVLGALLALLKSLINLGALQSNLPIRHTKKL